MFKFGKQFMQVLSGKKKILSSNPQMIGMIGVEVSMFESWYAERHNKALPDNELLTVIYNILDREQFIFSDEEAKAILSTVVVGFPQEQIKQMRIQNNFDSKVKVFCQSINCQHLL